MKTITRKERYMAIQEHELSVLAFAEAMRNADTKFISGSAHAEILPLTPNMAQTAMRFIMACARIENLNEKA